MGVVLEFPPLEKQKRNFGRGIDASRGFGSLGWAAQHPLALPIHFELKKSFALHALTNSRPRQHRF